MSALQLAFLNIGQGDTTIVYDPASNEAVVIDCVNSIPVFEFLESIGIKRLRALILTHAHADHYSGIVDLLDNCEQRGISWDAFVFRWEDTRKMPALLRDSDNHSEIASKKRLIDRYSTLIGWAKRPEVKKKHIQPENLPRDTRLLRAINFLHPKHQDWQELFDTGNLNNLSYVIRIANGASALLMGDIEPEGWRFLRHNHPDLLASTILKFPHHGVWRNGDISQMLNEIDPQFIIISVGTLNTYGHPAAEVFTEIRKRKNIRLLCTQATPQCCKKIKDARHKILQIRERADALRISTSEKKETGCPCAGTVIIELGSGARIISPSLELHVNQIIKPYMKNHRCSLSV